MQVNPYVSILQGEKEIVMEKKEKYNWADLAVRSTILSACIGILEVINAATDAPAPT